MVDRITIDAVTDNKGVKTLIQSPYFKVAHHTWIKFLKSRRNSLMMKNKVTYDRYECTNSK